MAINNIFTNLTLPLYVDCGDKILYTFDSDSKLIQNIAVASALILPPSNCDLKAKLLISIRLSPVAITIISGRCGLLLMQIIY